MLPIKYTGTIFRENHIIKGQITVNGEPIDNYFDRDVSVMIAMQPLELTETASQFDIAARCDGGGKSQECSQPIV